MDTLSLEQASALQKERSNDSPAIPAIDWRDADNIAISRRVSVQSALRDNLRGQSQGGDIYCSDGGTGDCLVDTGHRGSATATDKQRHIASDVETILSNGSSSTLLNYWRLGVADLALAGAGNGMKTESPFLTKRTSYWETISRPYEKQLVEQLAQGQGVITHAQMAQTALKMCNNDRYLTVLTLANFTKNMAAIERRRVEPNAIDASLRDTYTEQKIDAIFNRIEGFADDPAEKYNKEGAIYHFYGAMFFATALPWIAKAAVWCDNVQLVEFGGSDRIKGAAGLLGADVGTAL